MRSQEVFTQLFGQASSQVLTMVPYLIAAVAVLVVGWLFAAGSALVLRRALRRTTLDNRLAAWITGRDAASQQVPVESWIAKGLFYFVMLFVVIAFFQILNLTLVTEPLNRLVTEIAVFLPKLLGAGLLLVSAWILASLTRRIVRDGLDVVRLDERLGTQLEVSEKNGPMVSKTIAETLYWLVLLLFLPAVLGALELEGLMQPLQNLTDRILGFLPNLFAAGLILAIGWLVAYIVQGIVSNLFAATGADQLSERVGLGKLLGKKQLSWLLGYVVYVLVLLPVVIASLGALGLETITQPASAMLSRILAVFPLLLGAAFLLGLAYLVGHLVSTLTSSILEGAGFNNILFRLGLQKTSQAGSRSPSAIVGHLVLVAIMLLASIEASRLVGFETLADLAQRFVSFSAQVIMGLVVFALGLYLANLAARTVLASDVAQATSLATAARVSIIALAGAIALRHAGLADEIIELAFGLSFGSVAVAAALAFGLGSRDLAGNTMKQWVERLNSHREDRKSP